MRLKNLYDVLGVSTQADAATIKGRYRELARELHPDRTGGDKVKARRFAEVAAAYSVLSNDATRAKYDTDRTSPEFGTSVYGAMFGQDFEDLVDKVRTEGISGGNLDDLISEFFGVAKRIKKEAPERMKAAAQKAGQVRTGTVSPGEERASPGGILSAIETLFGLDQFVASPTKKTKEKKK